jgi:hypothetical protein
MLFANACGLRFCLSFNRFKRTVVPCAFRVGFGDSNADGGYAAEIGEEVIYKINYDNVYHLKYRLSQRGDVAREVVTEKYILGMRILLLGYEHALRSAQKAKGNQGNGFAEYADDFRRMAARGASSTVLALAENLPKIVDASSVQGQEVE